MTSASFGYDAFRRTCTVAHRARDAGQQMGLSRRLRLAPRHGCAHGELARKIEGITPKMLTQTLA